MTTRVRPVDEGMRSWDLHWTPPRAGKWGRGVERGGALATPPSHVPSNVSCSHHHPRLRHPARRANAREKLQWEQGRDVLV